MSHDESTQKRDKTPEEKHLDAVKGHTHHFVEGYDGGKCLWHGIYVYQVHSCSYRYQAIGRASEDSSVYNWPAYEKAVSSEGEKIKTSGRKTKKGFYPKNYYPELNAPTAAGMEWDLTGMNFHTQTKPYWNQPHHLIPVATLHNSLWNMAVELAVTRLGEGKKIMVSAPELALYIGESLLRAGYNVNHKINMIILPMDNAVSDILRLPKHGGAKSNNHKQYNALVGSELDKIMNFYRSYFCDMPDKEHLSESHRQAQKRRLELLSGRIYKLITRYCLRGKPALGQDYTGGKSLESETSEWS